MKAGREGEQARQSQRQSRCRERWDSGADKTERPALQWGRQYSGTGNTLGQAELGKPECGHPLDSYTSLHSQFKSVWVLARLISIIRVEIAQVCIVTVCAERMCVKGVCVEGCVCELHSMF